MADRVTTNTGVVNSDPLLEQQYPLENAAAVAAGKGKNIFKKVIAWVAAEGGAAAVAGSGAVYLGYSALSAVTGGAAAAGLLIPPALVKLHSYWLKRKGATHQPTNAEERAALACGFKQHLEALLPHLSHKVFIHQTFAGREVYAGMLPETKTSLQAFIMSFSAFISSENSPRTPILDSSTADVFTLQAKLSHQVADIQTLIDSLKTKLESKQQKNDFVVYDHPPESAETESLLERDISGITSPEIENLEYIQDKIDLLNKIVEALIFYEQPCTQELLHVMFYNEMVYNYLQDLPAREALYERTDIQITLTDSLPVKFVKALEEWDKRLKNKAFFPEGSILINTELACDAFFQEFEKQIRAGGLEKKTTHVQLAGEASLEYEDQAGFQARLEGRTTDTQEALQTEALQFLENFNTNTSFKACLEVYMNGWHNTVFLPPYVEELRTLCDTLKGDLLQIREAVDLLASQKEFETLKAKREYFATKPLSAPHRLCTSLRKSCDDLQSIRPDEAFKAQVEDARTTLHSMRAKLNQLVDLKYAFQEHMYAKYIAITRKNPLPHADTRAIECICSIFSDMIDQIGPMSSREAPFEKFWQLFTDEIAKHKQEPTFSLTNTQLFSLSWKLPDQLKEEAEDYKAGWHTYNTENFFLDSTRTSTFIRETITKPGATIAILIHATCSETKSLDLILTEMSRNKIAQDCILQSLITPLKIG